MSKNYTAEEFAKKLNVSPGTVYDRIRKGEIAKVNNLGRIVRIPSSELNKFKSMRNYFLYNPEKVEAIETTLGKIRKIKGDNSYVLVDVAKAVGFNDTYKLTKAIDKKHTTKLTAEEARDLGLFTNQFGILLINNEGIKQYSSKSRNKSRVDNLMKELNIGSEPKKDLTTPIEIKEIIDTDLTPIEIALGVDGEGNTTARKLFKFLELDKSNFSRWAKMNIENNIYYEENKDWVGFVIMTNGNECKDYKLTTEFAKHLAMSSQSQKGKLARDYFVAVEERVKQNNLSSNKSAVLDNPYTNFSTDTQKLMLKDLYEANSEMLEKVRLNTRAIAKLESLLESRC